MIRVITGYIVECDGDGCNDVIDDDGTRCGTVYDTEEDAEKAADSQDWSIGTNEVFCPECSGKESK